MRLAVVACTATSSTPLTGSSMLSQQVGHKVGFSGIYTTIFLRVRGRLFTFAQIGRFLVEECSRGHMLASG